jgi:heme/copper-type cytochrome/quinol oxidase subunit 2
MFRRPARLREDALSPSWPNRLILITIIIIIVIIIITVISVITLNPKNKP